jgi:hypothetical protein
MNKELVKKIGIWALALALLMAHILFRNVAQADTGPSWKQTYAKNGECTIEFPVQPQMVQQSLKVSEEGHKLTYDVYLAPFEDKGVFLLLIATYPLPMAGGHEIAGLEGLIKGIVSHHVDNRLIFAKMMDHGGHPAINFLVQNGSSYFRGQALMVENKLFLIAMEGRKGEMDEETFNRFLKSFQLID